MNVLFELMRGMAVGIEFPGEGINLVLHLGPLRVMFITNELVDKIGVDEE